MPSFGSLSISSGYRKTVLVVSNACVHTALVAGKTRTLVTRVELDLIGWYMPQPFSKSVISGGSQATIRMQFGEKLHALLSVRVKVYK